jgi:diguanylate cyclase (GGDEF)-like protein
VSNHIELKRLRDQLAEMAVTDALTGLSNRRRMEQKLNAETERLAQSEDWLSVLLIDIDFFKQFNDTYGHLNGDRCIVMIASALKRALTRASDLSARYGGEEFACVLPGADAAAALTMAEEIQVQVGALNIPHARSTVSPNVTISIGIATGRCQPGMTPDKWIAHADQQLYRSKASGRNTITAITFGTSGAEENTSKMAS